LNIIGKIEEDVADDEFSMEESVCRLEQLGLKINTVIDIGASHGIWSSMCMKYFRDSFYFLVEAKGVHEDKLRYMKECNRNMDYIIAAAGDNIGEIFFTASEDLYSGSASHSEFKQNCVVTPMITIDSCIRERRLNAPYMLKLDTHGFEVPIFEGAMETLWETEVIIIETYNFKISDEALRFHEMCKYLEDKGFRCFDLISPMHRPKDKALWQMDLVFLRDNHPVFLTNSYI